MIEDELKTQTEILREIRDLLKPKQEIKIIEKKVFPKDFERLREFKEFITSNDFFNSLTEKQRERVIKLM